MGAREVEALHDVPAPRKGGRWREAPEGALIYGIQTPFLLCQIDRRKGELIGIEIHNASRFVRDSSPECIQGKMLDLCEAKSVWQRFPGIE
jgi:hypothetical protein